MRRRKVVETAMEKISEPGQEGQEIPGFDAFYDQVKTQLHLDYIHKAQKDK